MFMHAAKVNIILYVGNILCRRTVDAEVEVLTSPKVELNKLRRSNQSLY
jgi:hypothetical protein